VLIGVVCEAVVAPTRHPALAGAKLLYIAVSDADDTRMVLAVDSVGAGVGDHVVVALGTHAVALVKPAVPTDAVVVGILDRRS
jgi:ethanolamine utilization protein EutN